MRRGRGVSFGEVLLADETSGWRARRRPGEKTWEVCK